MRLVSNFIDTFDLFESDFDIRPFISSVDKWQIEAMEKRSLLPREASRIRDPSPQ